MSELNLTQVLILDVDGTLTPVDTLKILRLRLLLRRPFNARQMKKWRQVSKQLEKNELWREVQIKSRPALNKHVINFARNWIERGGRVDVITGSAVGVGAWVSEASGLKVTNIFGSTHEYNLTKAVKAEFIQKNYVGLCTTYVGDSVDDLFVWKVVDNAVCVGWSNSELESIETKNGDSVQVIPDVNFLKVVQESIRLVLIK